MDESRGPAQNPEVHHEMHDVNVRAILWFAAGFVVMAIVIHVGLYFLFLGFAARERARADQPLTLVTRVGRQVPPLPRLQPFPEVAPEWKGAQQHALFKTPVDDMDELRATEDQVLNSYGWVDPKAGTVRIPIQRAMELTLQRGLPVRQSVSPTTPAPPAEPTP